MDNGEDDEEWFEKNDIVTVKISETDEVNLLGRLLEKYVPDSKYNPEDNFMVR